jgi:surface protein
MISLKGIIKLKPKLKGVIKATKIQSEYEEIYIVPSTEEQVIEGAFSKVTVAGTGKTAKITSGYWLFYNGNRSDYINELLDLCNNITTAENMFTGCKELTELDVSKLDTSEVTTMKNMFQNCSKLTQLDVSTFDTSNVTNMENIFAGCLDLTELDASKLDTSKVTTMYGMFQNCSKLTEIDVSNFNTNNVTNMGRMFYGCSKLAKLDIRNFTFDKVSSGGNMFNNVPADCEIIVKSDTEKQWVLTQRSDFTNVKTVAELES